jgi:hypothetical protein
MSAMGPEALLLSSRLAEQHALRLYGSLEMPSESSMYVEVCLRSQLPVRAPYRRAESHRSVWARLAARLRTPARAEGREGQGATSWLAVSAEASDHEPGRSISAAAIDAAGRPSAGVGGGDLPLALHALAGPAGPPSE